MKHDLIIDQPSIEAEGFVLRSLRASDVGLIELYASDERVAKNTSVIPHPLPPTSTEAFVARAMSETRDEDVWAMDASGEGGPEVMGLISLTPLERAQSEVGYWVAPAFWNGGLATAAVNALINANPQGCTSLFASVFQDNPASARVLSNAGFEYLGDAETFSVARGNNVTTWTYIKKYP